VEWLANDPGRAQGAWPALLPSEAVSLEGWEQGAKVDRPALRFHELFERLIDTADQRDRPAVITQAGALSYGALEREANAIAHGLLLRGTAAGSVIGVLTGRSASLPAAVLGIWKAGATYLPLSADLPQDRLAFMARDAGVAHLIALDGLSVPPGLPRGPPTSSTPRAPPASPRVRSSATTPTSTRCWAPARPMA
jgi:non-ribosomal peptide synthetase component F